MIDLRRIPEPSWVNGPDYPEPPLYPVYRCGCGAWLPNDPGEVIYTEDATDCSGTVRWSDIPYDESEIRILGDEYRGRTFRSGYADCGPSEADHEPHRVINWVSAEGVWHCRRCGREVRLSID